MIMEAVVIDDILDPNFYSAIHIPDAIDLTDRNA